MNGLEVKPAAGVFKPKNRSSMGHIYQLQVPDSRTDTYLHSYFSLAVRLWNSVPSSDSTYLQICTGGLNGKMCLNAISINDF